MHYTHLSYFLEVAGLQEALEFQNSDIREILALQLLSRWADTFLVFPILPQSIIPDPLLIHYDVETEHTQPGT